ncbi:MAG: metal ABC transporter permease [Pseudomonadota bacterium]
MVIAMVVTPGATAYLLTDQFHRLIQLSVVFGVLNSALGAYVSYFLDANPCGLIVCLQTLMFVFALVLHLDMVYCAEKGMPMDSIAAFIIGPLSFEFMQRAQLMSVLIAMVCSVFLCPLILKGWSLMGDAFSHAVLPGLAIAFIIDIPLMIGAFVASLFCAIATGYIKENGRIKEDAIMGIIFSGMFGLGPVMLTKIKTDVHLLNILFGNVLGITWFELIEAGLIAIVCSVIMLIKRKDFLLYCFDAATAQFFSPKNAKILRNNVENATR